MHEELNAVCFLMMSRSVLEYIQEQYCIICINVDWVLSKIILFHKFVPLSY